MGDGLGSGLSGFDFTCDRSPVLAPSARRLSRKGAGTRCTGIEEEGSLEPFGFQISGRIHPESRPGIPDRLLRKVSTRADVDAVLFCSRMAERPLTWRVVQRTVRKAEVRWGEYAKLRPRELDFSLRIGPKPLFECDAK